MVSSLVSGLLRCNSLILCFLFLPVKLVLDLVDHVIIFTDAILPTDETFFQRIQMNKVRFRRNTFNSLAEMSEIFKDLETRLETSGRAVLQKGYHLHINRFWQDV